MVYKFIDLFAGIGGTRLAFERSGGNCVFSSEIDKFARKTYFANFKEMPAGDILNINVPDIPNHDILIAGFPCQPFSLSGVSKRNSLDRPHGFQCKVKGRLFFKIVEILQKKQPKAFMLENVKNLKSHNNGNTYRTICILLKLTGYDVVTEIIDSKNIVPQHRERIYIVGFRNDLDITFRFPEIPRKKPKLKDILQHNIDPKYTLSDKLWNYLKEYKVRQRRKGNGFGYGIADLDGITRTLSARYYKDGAEILIPQGEEQNPRKLTPRECARLMGFPDSFEIPVSNTQAYKQFGNSVVVPLVELIARSMVECLSRKKVLIPIIPLFKGSEESKKSCSNGEETTTRTSLGETPQIISTA